MKVAKVFLTISLIACSGLAARGQGQEIIFSLVNTDKELAHALQEDGLRKGFLKYLDRESLVFTPTATDGPSYYRKLDADSAWLYRFPAWAEASDDGLLGYTSGIFEYRDLLTDAQPSKSGHYLTIWRRKSFRDKWKIILNMQIEYDKAEALREVNYDQPLSGKIPITPAYELIKSKQILLDSDELFNVSLKAGRVEFGFNEFFEDDVQLYRQNYAPILGRDKAMQHQTQMKGKYVYKTSDGYMSLVRDIAYTFGTGHYFENIRTSRFDQYFSYVRIWRKNRKGLWKVILEMEKPFDNNTQSIEIE